MRKSFVGFFLLDYYKYHVIVFLVALFIALTFAHPQFLVNDEWVTANQLAQMMEGHQVIINEGKYGVFENGTITPYFIWRNNRLGYTIFLPLISLPAYWVVERLGNQFPYFILILWTLIPLFIGMLIKFFLNDSKILGRWKLSSTLFIISFIVFLINLYYYVSFTSVGKNTYPEIEAIVFTNIFCYAILAVLIYEILITIFNDTRYSLFGTAVCLSCSSYLIWTTCTKDHMLVALLYAALLVSIVYYYKKRDRWFFPMSCLLTGLIAWARPELALPTFIGTVAFYWFTFRSVISPQKQLKDILFMIVSPFFVFIGALPFFINNYFITNNPFVPTWTIYGWGDSQVAVSAFTASGPLESISISWIEKIVQVFFSEMGIRSDTFLVDLYKVFFNPQNGNMGVFCLTPLFLIALFLIPIIILMEKHTFSQEEQFFLISMIFFSVLVLAAYIGKIYGIHTDPGILPDMRYLSPAYLPLNVAGLVVLRKIPDLSENSSNLLKIMFSLAILLIPIVLLFNVYYYPISEQQSWSVLFIPLNIVVSIGIYILIAIFLLMHLLSVFFQKQLGFWKILIISAILCLPFVWQIAASFIMRIWGSGLGGYSFWIPIMRVFYAFLFLLSPIQ